MKAQHHCSDFEAGQSMFSNDKLHSTLNISNQRMPTPPICCLALLPKGKGKQQWRKTFQIGEGGGGGGGGGGELFVCFWPKVALQLSLSCEEFPVLSTI